MKLIPENQLLEIEAIVRNHPNGIGIGEISEALTGDLPRRTLQYRLRYLVDEGRLKIEGARRGAKYLPAEEPERELPQQGQVKQAEVELSLSKTSIQVQQYIKQAITARKPVGYEREFLDSYRPNATAYFSEEERAHLKRVGTPDHAERPAGTYAKQILNRLLIDLSWNSSRLEGNTYSLLDTKRLIDFGQEAEGKEQLEAQMILNHKDAIEFLVGAAEDIGFNRYTILNLHALLANNLLDDPEATGRLRRIPVGIEQSVFHPLEAPQAIEECFDQILATVSAIEDPFEQSLFVMVQLPYLQPFDDVNKRVSRLAANVPLIKENLVPLSFTDVPEDAYTEAMLGIYELNDIALLKDIYKWAYERSAARYAAVQQSLGEPDPFRLRHRDELRDVIGDIVRGAMDKKSAFAHLEAWSKANITVEDQEKFREVAEGELLALHEGNFARYQIRPSEFQAWQKKWRLLQGRG